jgi:signal transduction histidine kinase/CheY-like chemotaxis protein/HPt (histidine-containing phosphotransfer) domain-containing protein
MINDYLHSLPIKQKIVAISMITSVMVVVLASVVLLYTQYFINQSSLIESTSALARLTGVNIQAALTFKDKKTAHEILSSLAEKPQIISSEIIKPNGQLFVKYTSLHPEHKKLLSEERLNEHDDVLNDTYSENSVIVYTDYISVIQKIYVNNKVIGFIDIHTDKSQLSNAFTRFLIIAVIVFFIVSYLGFLLINWMQIYITRPINSLASTIQAVSDDQNYNRRADKYSDDELGLLTDGFNHMLEQIFIRDKKLAQTLVKLEEANESVKKASQAKSSFLASMSHEIRTPMNGVLGMTSLLLQTTLDDKQWKYANVIKNSGKTLLTIINDILDFSKIEANKIVIEDHVFNLHNLIFELENLFSERIKQSNITLTIDMDDSCSYALLGDVNRLNQILYNLLGNAIKFTQEGKITVKCCIKETHIENTEEKILLYFSIEDNGLGISQNKQAQLFEPFFQAHHKVDNNNSGTGLGLAIAKRLCEAMGGDMGFKSQLGKGSLFWFTVLVERCNEENKEQDVINNQQQEKLPHIQFSSHILLAEDNNVNQDVAIGSLEYFGCTVTVVNNGKEAMDLFSQQHFDLVFMDYSMPIMDGIIATQNIRNLEKQQARIETPIIALTAHALVGIKQECLDAGMNDYLSKPFSLSEVLGMLKKWLPEAQQTVEKTIDSSIMIAQKEVTLALVDRGIIEQLRAIQQKDSPSILKKMIDHYLREFPKLLQNLEKSLSAKDTKNTILISHSLKSSSLAIGANSMAQCFKEMEFLARADKLEMISLADVHHYQAALIAELEALRDAEY